jgi:hypothetical protein
MKNHERPDGQAVPIADCYVWAEICYLDSATDYREYLPGNTSFDKVLWSILLAAILVIVLTAVWLT